MRMRYLALAGWLLADLGFALAFVGMGDSGGGIGGPPPTTEVPRRSQCETGLQPTRHLLMVDLSGLPQAQPGDLEPPPGFVDAVKRQVRSQLDWQLLSGQTVGLIQTFTSLDDDAREVSTSLWVNVALLGLPEADALGPALPEGHPEADLRVRHFIGDSRTGTAEIEWFLINEECE